MTSDIKLTYIDDKLDPLLDEYLFTLSEKEHIFEYDYYKFSSSEDSYQSLLENTNIASSDIIIVDSKLFENEFADSKSKFTGQELKIIYAIANPFIKIIVITQNNDLSKYGVIKKFATSRECSGREQEEANRYYDNVLRKEIETLIKNVKEVRNVGQLLSENILFFISIYLESLDIISCFLIKSITSSSVNIVLKPSWYILLQPSIFS